MVVTRHIMEKRIEGLERKFDELKELIIAQAKKEHRRTHRRRHQNLTRGDDEGSSVLGGDSSNSDSISTSRSPSRSTKRDFGGRKLKIPIFRGADAYGWIVRAERYFKLNQVDEWEKLDAVVIALEDQALSWYQWWEEQNEDRSWETFKAAVIRRFQPDPIGSGLGKEAVVEAAGPDCIVPGQTAPVILLGLKVWPIEIDLKFMEPVVRELKSIGRFMDSAVDLMDKSSTDR